MTTEQNLQATLRSSYRAAYNAIIATAPSAISQIYTSAEIETTSSEEHWLGDIPGIEEWVDERTYQDLAQYSQVLTSKPYTTRGWRYNRVQNAGDNVQTLRDRMTGTIEQCTKYPDEYIVKLLASGQSTDAFDGVNFFSNVSGVRRIDNLLAGTGTSEDALMADLTSVFVAMSKFTSDTGNLVNVIPDTVVCPMILYFKFRKIFESTGTLVANQNSGVINVFRDEFNLNIVWSPYLTDENDWYAISTRQGIFSLYWQTTMVDGQRVILDIDETKLAAAGYAGVAGSIMGTGAFGLPWAAVKVTN